VLLSVLALTEMLATPATLLKLIPGVFAVLGVPDKDRDDGRAGADPPFPRVRTHAGYRFFRER